MSTLYMPFQNHFEAKKNLKHKRAPFVCAVLAVLR